MSRLFTGLSLIIAILTVAAKPAHADAVVPGNVAGLEGNSNNAFPFNIGFAGDASTMRYQQVYAAAEFTGPVLILGMAFRPDVELGSAFSSILPSVQINLSTTTAAVDGLSIFFANNVGANVTTVFNGELSLSSSFTGPAAGPKDSDILIPFTTSFVYNPALGNLLLDVRNFGGGSTRQFDSQSGVDSVSRVFSSCVLGNCSGVNNPVGILSTEGLVTKFTTAPIPEPNSLLLLATGLAALAVGRVRRHR